MSSLSIIKCNLILRLSCLHDKHIAIFAFYISRLTTAGRIMVWQERSTALQLNDFVISKAIIKQGSAVLLIEPVHPQPSSPAPNSIAINE